MKKSLLALAIAAVAASSAASAATVYDKDGSSLDVYGRVQGVLYSAHAVSEEYNTYDDSSLQATGRLGFNMRTNLTSGIDAFANLEWDVADGHDNKSFYARYAYLGLDFGSYGVLKAGKFENAVKYVIEATDIFDDFGAKAITVDERYDGMFMYSISNSGFDLNLSFQTAQDKQPQANYGGADIDVNHAYAASVGYTSPDVLFGPISVKAGYSFIKAQTEYNNDRDNPYKPFVEESKMWASSISWGNLDSGLYLAAMYNELDDKQVKTSLGTGKYSAEGFETVVGYGFSNGISLRTGYNHIHVKISDDKEATARVIPVYLNYQINPAFNVWTEARFDMNTDKGFGMEKLSIEGEELYQNVYSIGARYSF